MSAMEPKSDSVPNESENTITSETTEIVETLTVSPTGGATDTKHDVISRAVPNDETPPMTEMKTDEGDGMNSL